MLLKSVIFFFCWALKFVACSLYTGQQKESQLKYPPRNYRFGYEIEDGFNNKQYFKEDSDVNNVKKGMYGYIDALGIYRKVSYIADDKGFRASIYSNEPGLSSQRQMKKLSELSEGDNYSSEPIHSNRLETTYEPQSKEKEYSITTRSKQNYEPQIYQQQQTFEPQTIANKQETYLPNLESEYLEQKSKYSEPIQRKKFKMIISADQQQYRTEEKSNQYQQQLSQPQQYTIEGSEYGDKTEEEKYKNAAEYQIPSFNQTSGTFETKKNTQQYEKLEYEKHLINESPIYKISNEPAGKSKFEMLKREELENKYNQAKYTALGKYKSNENCDDHSTRIHYNAPSTVSQSYIRHIKNVYALPSSSHKQNEQNSYNPHLEHKEQILNSPQTYLQPEQPETYARSDNQFQIYPKSQNYQFQNDNKKSPFLFSTHKSIKSPYVSDYTHNIKYDIVGMTLKQLRKLPFKMVGVNDASIPEEIRRAYAEKQNELEDQEATISEQSQTENPNLVIQSKSKIKRPLTPPEKGESYIGSVYY